MLSAESKVSQEQEWLEEVYAERGQEVPEELRQTIAEAPELTATENRILHDYMEVRTERPVSGFGGLLSIPWYSLYRFATLNGYVEAEIDWFIRIVRRIDGEVSKDVNEKTKRKKSKK